MGWRCKHEHTCNHRLHPNYNQQDMRAWLARQKSPTYPQSTRDYLLMASRNTMKSTASLCLAACSVLCAPSIRLLLVSETTKLSKDFIKLFRGLWERGSNPAYERFQIFFAEFCIEAGNGKQTEFTSPMRGFVLPQETAEVASLETSVAGRRADLQLYDDVISNLNTANNDQRKKGLATYYALTKLREAGAGITVTIGTPWVTSPGGGEIGDLYFELIKNNDTDPDHPMAVLIQPAMVLKPEAQSKLPDRVLEITLDDVEELTCPTRWSFKELMKEARKDVNMFLSQNLVMYVQTEESKWTLTFTLEELQSKVRPLGFFNHVPLVTTIAAVDTAFSTAATADRSSICMAKLIQYEGRMVCFVVDVIAGRWKYSDLAVQIVEAFQRHRVQRAVIERTGPWQELQAGIQRNAVLRAYLLPQIIWNIPTGTGTTVSAKVKRIKGFEMLFQNSQVYFANAPWNEGFFAETVKFNGQRSNNTRKDDQIDSASMLGVFIQRDTGASIEQSEEQLEFEEQARIQTLIRGNYDRIFGNPQAPQQQYIPPPEPERPGGLIGTLGRIGMVRNR